MSRRYNILAVFERKAPPLDYFIGEKDKWCEVTKAFVGLEAAIVGQRSEATDAAKQTSIVKSTCKTIWTPTLAKIDSACRMKIRRINAVDEQNPNADANFRIFQIDSMVNVNEQNRELQLNVLERV